MERNTSARGLGVATTEQLGVPNRMCTPVSITHHPFVQHLHRTCTGGLRNAE
jgi:hypothetical protein